jgi:cytidylate kinase
MDRQRPYPQSPGASTSALADALAAAPPSAGVTRVLAIDGRSGSGKSTIARSVAALIEAPLISLEDLYGGWDGLEHGIELLRREVLEPLARGEQAAVPRYDWQARAWAPPWALESPARLVIEGVGAGARVLAPHTSLLAWLELTEEARRERALARDGDLYAPHWTRWAAQEEAYLARNHPREHADLVLMLAAPGSL